MARSSKRDQVLAAYQRAVDAGHIAEIEKAEAKYGIPSGLLVGMVAQESMFNVKAVSSAGANGILQFMPKTAERFGIDSSNVAQSADAAGKYLSVLHNQFGSWKGATSAYNWGEGNYSKWLKGKRKMPKETADYYGKVTGMSKMISGKPISLKTRRQSVVTSDPVAPTIPAVDMVQLESLIQQPLIPVPSPVVGAGDIPSVPDVASDIVSGTGDFNNTQPLVKATEPNTSTVSINNPVAINTSYGSATVVPESAKEVNIIKSLSDDHGLIPHIPELLKAASKDNELIKRKTSFDKLLLSVMETV